MAVILDYATPEATDRAKSRLVTTAIVCGLAPLVAGMSVLTMCFITEDPDFFPLVVLAWLLGFVFVLVGAACLVVHLFRLGTAGPWWRLSRREWCAALLLLSRPE